MSKIRFTPEQEKEICVMYKNNSTFKKISEKFNTSNRTIKRVLNTYHIKIRTISEHNTEKFRLEYDKIKFICYKYKNGSSINYISKKLNISWRLITRTLKENNIKIRNIHIEITPEIISKIYIMYAKGYSINTIEKELNISLSQVRRILRENNVKLRTKCEHATIKFDQVEIKRMEELYTSGLTLEQVGKEFKVSKSTIRKILKKNNIKIRNNYIFIEKINTEKEKRICESYNNEYSIRKISKEFNVSFTSVRKILIKNNIRIRKRGEITIGEKHPMYGKRGNLSHTYGKTPVNCSGYGKGEYYESQLQGKIWLRSQIEIKMAKFYDSHGILWTYETDHFPVILDNKQTTYTPDFYLINYDIYIEVKGRRNKNSKNISNIDKINAFRQQYPDIHLDIIFYDDLKIWNIK